MAEGLTELLEQLEKSVTWARPPRPSTHITRLRKSVFACRLKVVGLEANLGAAEGIGPSCDLLQGAERMLSQVVRHPERSGPLDIQ